MSEEESEPVGRAEDHAHAQEKQREGGALGSGSRVLPGHGQGRRGAGDAQRDVDLGLDDLAGLANLARVRDPARVDRGTARPDDTAEGVCQRPDLKDSNFMPASPLVMPTLPVRTGLVRAEASRRASCSAGRVRRRRWES